VTSVPSALNNIPPSNGNFHVLVHFKIANSSSFLSSDVSNSISTSLIDFRCLNALPQARSKKRRRRRRKGIEPPAGFCGDVEEHLLYEIGIPAVAAVGAGAQGVAALVPPLVAATEL